MGSGEQEPCLRAGEQQVAARPGNLDQINTKYRAPWISNLRLDWSPK